MSVLTTRRSRASQTGRWLRGALLYGLTASAMVYVLAPFVWIILSSIQSQVDLIHVPPYFPPRAITLQNYLHIFVDEPSFKQGFVNSLIVASATTVLCTVVSIFAAYALARLNPLGKSVAPLIVLGVQMLPGIVIVIPLFILLRTVGLLNTYGGLILIYLGFLTPVITWILRGFFLSIPPSIEEAAVVDGCSQFQVLLLIVLPLSGPALVTAAIFTFIESWNEFFFALILASRQVKTLPVALAENQGHYLINYQVLATGAVVATLPVVVLVLLFQRYIVKGLTEGAVKG
jgi:multiple sugar transport system permease protein